MISPLYSPARLVPIRFQGVFKERRKIPAAALREIHANCAGMTHPEASPQERLAWKRWNAGAAPHKESQTLAEQLQRVATFLRNYSP